MPAGWLQRLVKLANGVNIAQFASKGIEMVLLALPLAQVWGHLAAAQVDNAAAEVEMVHAGRDHPTSYWMAVGYER
jgi:hypothetical protein